MVEKAYFTDKARSLWIEFGNNPLGAEGEPAFDTATWRDGAIFLAGDDVERLVAGSDQALRNVFNSSLPIIALKIRHDQIRVLHNLVEPEAAVSVPEPAGLYALYAFCRSKNGSFNELKIQEQGESESCKEELADSLSAWLTECFDSDNAILASAGDAPNELTLLAASQNLTTTWCSPSVEFHNGGKPDGKNRYQVTLFAWAVHSEVDGCNYYFFKQSGIFANGPCYKPPYKKKAGSACSKYEEWYVSLVDMQCIPLIDNKPSKDVILIDPSPATTEISESVTTGISWNLGGEVSYNKENGPAINVAGGVSVNSMKTIQINKIRVENHCLNDPKSSNAKWWYYLSKTDSKFNFWSYGQVDLIKSSNSGKNTFTTENVWIYKFPKESCNKSQAVKMLLNVDITSSRGRLKAPGLTEVEHKNAERSEPHTAIMTLRQPPKK